MNEMLRAQLDRINAACRELADALDRQRADMGRIAEQRDRLQQEQWALQRSLAALNRASEDYDRVVEQCEALRAREAQLRERLERVLAAAKALSTELRT